MFHKLFKSLKIEIKNAIFATWFHFIRFGGLLLIPLIYGFSYVFAFWDPFTKVDQLPIALVTQQKDIFGDAVGNVMNKTQSAQIGELKLNMKAQHIYADVYDASNNIDPAKVETFKNEQMHNYNVGFVLPSLTDEVDKLVVSSINGGLPLLETFNLFNKLTTDKIQLINNFKKNYLIAFGVDLGSSMSGTQKMMAGVIVKALSDDNYRQHIVSYGASRGITDSNYSQFVKSISSLADSLSKNNFEFVRTETHMHEHAKYGYGLAPFFISVAMWVGAMVMTFAIHKKIYDKSVGPVARYFAKWLLIGAGTIVQATILMVALYIIGLDKLGLSHWGSMYGFAIFTGIVFGTIVQAIRFIIPSRNLGIFAAVILLVLQMASAGGLFPIETQAKGYQVLNMLLPMGHTVRIYRELAFETRWEVVGAHIGYLLIYPALFLPFGVILNTRATNRWYRDQHIKLPETVKRRKGGA